MLTVTAITMNVNLSLSNAFQTTFRIMPCSTLDSTRILNLGSSKWVSNDFRAAVAFSRAKKTSYSMNRKLGGPTNDVDVV